jgi:type II secretory pathway component PulF
MKHDEFAFFNQQLAGMLQSGIPLEGALQQLTRSMKLSKTCQEFVQLEQDLAQGIPLKEALEKRALPPLYLQVLKAGAESENVSGMLTMLADYYTRLHAITLKLKGLMVYPVIVLVLSLAVSSFLTVVFWLLMEDAGQLLGITWGDVRPLLTLFLIPPLLILSLLTVVIFALTTPRARSWLRWKLPGVRETSLARIASALAIMVKSGTTFETATRLLAETEQSSPAQRDLSGWAEAIRQGRTRFDQVALGSRVFPPLFVWLVAQGGDDLAKGFQKAATIYERRAGHMIDMMLFAALPFAVVLVGLVMLGQIYSVSALLVTLLDGLAM